MFLWKSDNDRRYASVYALNRMEAQANDGFLDIPKCQAQYTSFKRRLFGSFNNRSSQTFFSRLGFFSECLERNYPALYTSFNTFCEEGNVHYKEMLKKSKFKDRVAATREELNVMYKRVQERIERSEKESAENAKKKGEEHVPWQEPRVNANRKIMDELTGNKSSRYKSTKIL